MNEEREKKELEAEVCTCKNTVRRTGIHLIDCPAYKKPQEEQKEEDMSVEDICKAAITGEIKPSVGSDDFKEDCFALRAQIEETKIQTMLVFKEHPAFHSIPGAVIPEHGEMGVNLMLAFRHLEDASMRIGKAIQAFDGGKSCYPR